MDERLVPIRGEITEIVGGLSSGRTSHLLACLGDVVGRGETVPRLPTTMAFRLKFAVRRTDVAFLIVGCRRLTGSSAALALETLREGIEWAGPGPAPTHLARVRTTTRVLRARGAEFGRPPSSWWSA